jgi:hypothetical protein
MERRDDPARFARDDDRVEAEDEPFEPCPLPLSGNQRGLLYQFLLLAGKRSGGCGGFCIRVPPSSPVMIRGYEDKHSEGDTTPGPAE